MDSQVPPIIPPPVPVRKVKYRLDRRDLFAARLWVTSRNRFLLGFSILCAIFVTGSLATGPAFVNGSIGLKIFTLVGGFVAFSIFLVVLHLLSQLVFLFFRKNKGVVGTHELEICDDGLRQRTEVTEILHRWEGFHKIAPTRGCIFVYTTDNNVEYIPRRAFASGHESRQFEQELIARVERARSNAAN